MMTIKKINYILAILGFFALTNCASLTFRKSLVESSTNENLIRNAILDFSSTTSLYRRDSVFGVSVSDTLYRMVLNRIDDRNLEWVPGNIVHGVSTVRIGAQRNQFLLTGENGIGSKGRMPSRYLEKDGNLFYWYDDELPLSKEVLSVLKKYNLIVDDQGGTIKWIDWVTDDGLKSAHYYFCKTNFTKYERVITNFAMGFYDPPKVNCLGL